jgi:hypothetical protein
MTNAPSLSDRLIAEAAKSRDAEAWISRQILAGQKPSQILATLDRSTDAERMVRSIGGDGPVGLTLASILMFATPFIALGWLLPS